MPSTRSKLVLDEDSFQGLLAAAYTIQQYNDQQGGIDAALSAQLKGAARTNGSNEARTSPVGLVDEEPEKADSVIGTTNAPLDFCKQCGAPLLAAGSPCPACDAEVFRPGERLQRTWATMWSLSQEQGTFPGPALGELEVPLAGTNGNGAPAATDPAFAREATQSGEPDHEALALPVGVREVAAGGSAVPRLKVRFRRADLYLGLSVLVALIALLWPGASAGRSDLTPWERMLVAIGIAEAPSSQAEVHYSGDPNIKVWVDTEAALYYCPGDDLYGKSRGGYYATQHDAQLDRFEPALRRACVP